MIRTLIYRLFHLRKNESVTMGDLKRWSVTYTKHIKQKRKVYQDGFLELHNSTHKITLYDDCEKLLDSRNVKKDDVVRSGETLAFDAYLVDIGDPDGDHKPVPNLNFQGRDEKITKKAGLFNGHKVEHNSDPIGNRKLNSGKNKAPSSRNLSPSQKIIREFKKNEINKYSSPRNCPDTTKASHSEWYVLYTTQIIQKSKKYHDGILRVAICGSQGRQVTLYDVSRRLLDVRFLKKEEVIGSGESLAFDGHLVDIGEPEGDNKPVMDLKVQEKNCTAGGKTGLSHGQQAQHNSSVDNGNSCSSNSVSQLRCLKAVNTSMREWNALYTTQITQKAKKYHSGILRLASCGSFQMQATLLNEDGTILSRKYLKLSENVTSGSKFELPKYLVEVGEPRTNLDEKLPKNACSEKDVASNLTNFDVDDFKLGRRVPTDMPLRDANEILTILRKPMTKEGHVPITSASLEHCHASQSPEFIQFGLQNQVERHLVQESNCERNEADNHDEGTGKKHNPVALHDDIRIEIIKSADSEKRGESLLKHFTPSSSSLRSGASKVSSSNSEAERTDKIMLKPVSFIEKPQVVDVLKLTCPDDLQPPTASVPQDGTNRNMEDDSLKLMSSKAKPSYHGDPFSEELKIETSPQPNEESLEILTRQHEGAFFSCGIENSSGCISHEPSDIGKKSSGVYKSTRKMDEIPSFDLGF
ncbi:hypothetical protein LOK49_LG11G02853 [Camellia lanceoleosa]|uniref:Uncharacterized protein n=1 Tax=Camellia lanceoleosa TaxID=1840588 RepID=A0ACC0G3L5_9ERIC|nr:hypothetical protein LOK49_LG11G02853 [Camellia lanceoleosa]